MYRLRIESCLLLGAALLAGCSERNTPMAPSARPLAAATSVDQQYTQYAWSVNCSGDGPSYAYWVWAAAGVALASVSATCYPSSSPITASTARPATADSLRACISQFFSSTCKSWTLDPASVFKAQLKANATYSGWCFDVRGNSCKSTASATLDIADVR